MTNGREAEKSIRITDKRTNWAASLFEAVRLSLFELVLVRLKSSCQLHRKREITALVIGCENSQVP